MFGDGGSWRFFVGEGLFAFDLVEDGPAATHEDERAKQDHKPWAETPDAVVDGFKFAHLIRRMAEFAE